MKLGVKLTMGLLAVVLIRSGVGISGTLRIRAARAGDAGRGFSVVASEVRNQVEMSYE